MSSRTFDQRWPFAHVWAGDILHRETGRERGRGPNHEGQHRPRPTVAETVAAVKSRVHGFPAGERRIPVTFYPVVGEPPAPMTGTLTIPAVLAGLVEEVINA